MKAVLVAGNQVSYSVFSPVIIIKKKKGKIHLKTFVWILIRLTSGKVAVIEVVFNLATNFFVSDKTITKY